MRRPVKPFVTEYKGSGRRGVPTLREATAPEAPKSAPKPLDFAFPLEAEDSYEAAMRAADALFAPQPVKPAAPVVHREAPPPRIEALAIATPAAAESQPPAPIAPERPAGRILRVLDEPPLPEVLALAALEAEHAPKRRGRKPGSKNKPKPAMAAPLFPASMAEEPVLAQISDLSGEPAVGTLRQAVPAMARAAVATRRVAALPVEAAPASEKGPKRFSWVKDRLRPGEDWKRRRLPKVCW